MILGCLGDLHLTSRGSQRRLDNYFETQMRKLNQAFDIFEQEKCDYIFQVGDFFESPDVSNYVISAVIKLLRERCLRIYCCYGQHDITGHSAATLKRSPLKILEAAGVVFILTDQPIEFSQAHDLPRYGAMYAASFGEKVPIVDPDDPYNILVTHRMVGDRELYPGQELCSPRKFLRDNPDYNLVLCGDYHYRFSDKYDGRVIINPGCLMRKTISKFDLAHTPGVAVFNVNTNKLDIHKLDIQPLEEVFDLTKEDKKDNEKLMKFIESLQDNNESKVNWKRNLTKVLDEKKANKNVRKIIDDAMSSKGKEDE
jgi:exonuclease SbcD